MSYDPNVPNPPPRADGGNRTLFFIVGGLVVLAGVFVFIFTNNDVGTAPDTEVNVEAPAADPAAPPPAVEPVQPAPAPAPEGGTTTTQ